MVGIVPFSWSLGTSGCKRGPRQGFIVKWLDRAMILVAIMMCAAIFLQAGMIVHNKSSENVSMPSYVLLLISSLIWMCYGISWNDGLISLSGLVASAGSIFALVASVSYRPTSTPGAFSTL